ncbi:MAG: hypothetical protein AAGD11_08975 [Planctomycetota bacterium]
MVYLLVALGFIFFAGVAMTINESLWNNTITLICLIISGLVGAIGGVPLGVMVMDQAGKAGEFAWYFIFAGMWIVFVVTMLILRLLTDRISRIQVRFLPIVDKMGGWLTGVFVATMLEAFAAYTLLVAPIQAGAWQATDLKDVAHVLKMNRAAGPFTSVLHTVRKADGIDYPIYE